MYERHDRISDADFIAAFHNCTLDPSLFDHAGHLRLACLNLKAYPLDVAIEKTCAGIKAYAESLGADDKFHATITTAIVRIIDERITAGDGTCEWREFIEGNPDLVEDCLGVLGRYYSGARLFSEGARQECLEPDILDWDRTYQSVRAP